MSYINQLNINNFFKIHNRNITTYVAFILVLLITVSGAQAKNDLNRENLIKAESTWGKYLNLDGDMPTNKFKVFYINTNKPYKVISQETVDSISIKYSYSDFWGIPSEDFGAYWVGKFNSDKKVVKHITISQSWANTRLIIDDTIIYEGKKNKELSYTFNPGEHIIEVEYENNWHTTEFLVQISDEINYFSKNEILDILNHPEITNASLHYVFVHESDRDDLIVDVKIEDVVEPLILVLSSYDPVKWKLPNIDKTNVKAIIYSSYNPGSQVLGNLPNSIKILPYKYIIGSYRLFPRCKCVNNKIFHCDGDDVFTTLEKVKTLTDKKISGFTGKSSAKSVQLPEIILSEDKLFQVTEELKKIDKQEIECVIQ